MSIKTIYGFDDLGNKVPIGSYEEIFSYSITFPQDITTYYSRNGYDRTSTCTSIMAEIIIHYANGSTSTHQLSGDKTTVNTMSSILGQTINNVTSIEFKNKYSAMGCYISLYGTLDNLSEASHNGTVESQTTEKYIIRNVNGVVSVNFSLIGNVGLSQIKVDSYYGGG